MPRALNRSCGLTSARTLAVSLVAVTPVFSAAAEPADVPDSAAKKDPPALEEFIPDVVVAAE